MNRAATGLPTPLHHAPQRLWLARAIAWALLLGGWLVLGTLGRQHLPQAAGGQAPVALWLTTVGGALALVGRWRWSAPALALLGRSAIALLLVAASFAVRACAAQPGQPPTPIGPALAGAWLAWAVAGDLDALRQGVGPAALAPADLSKFLLSPMPGLLVEVAVVPGQAVQAGERLAVIEAMKMENILTATQDGVVREVMAAKGVRFAPGGIRPGAADHDIIFIHPKGNEQFALGGEGVLIELVQAPPEVIAALR